MTSTYSFAEALRMANDTTVKGIVSADSTGAFVEMSGTRQGLKVCRPEEIAFRCGYIDAEQLDRLAGALAKTHYGAYLTEIARQPF